MKKDKKRKVAKEIASQIVGILKNKGDMEILPLLIDELSGFSEKTKIEVISARPLATAERERVRTLVSKLTGEVADEIEFTQDEDLIDGMKIIYKDKTWDFSLKSQISSLA